MNEKQAETNKPVEGNHTHGAEKVRVILNYLDKEGKVIKRENYDRYIYFMVKDKGEPKGIIYGKSITGMDAEAVMNLAAHGIIALKELGEAASELYMKERLKDMIDAGVEKAKRGQEDGNRES